MTISHVSDMYIGDRSDDSRLCDGDASWDDSSDDDDDDRSDDGRYDDNCLDDDDDNSR